MKRLEEYCVRKHCILVLKLNLRSELSISNDAGKLASLHFIDNKTINLNNCIALRNIPTNRVGGLMVYMSFN